MVAIDLPSGLEADTGRVAALHKGGLYRDHGAAENLPGIGTGSALCGKAPDGRYIFPRGLFKKYQFNVIYNSRTMPDFADAKHRQS